MLAVLVPAITTSVGALAATPSGPSDYSSVPGNHYSTVPQNRYSSVPSNGYSSVSPTYYSSTPPNQYSSAPPDYLSVPASEFVVPPDYYYEAVQAFQRHDYATALRLAKRFLAAAPDIEKFEDHALIAQALFASGDYHAAASQVRVEVASALNFINWQTLYGYYNDRVSTLTAQLNALGEFVNAHPRDEDARLLLGYEYLIVGRPELARPQLATAEQLSPYDRFAAMLYRKTAETKTGQTKGGF